MSANRRRKPPPFTPPTGGVNGAAATEPSPQDDPHAGFIKYGALLQPSTLDALQTGARLAGVNEQQFLNNAIRLYKIISQYRGEGYEPAMTRDGYTYPMEIRT